MKKLLSKIHSKKPLLIVIVIVASLGMATAGYFLGIKISEKSDDATSQSGVALGAENSNAVVIIDERGVPDTTDITISQDGNITWENNSTNQITITIQPITNYYEPVVIINIEENGSRSTAFYYSGIYQYNVQLSDQPEAESISYSQIEVK